jgi:DNA-directed RNA polymerase specialized sigma subunit
MTAKEYLSQAKPISDRLKCMIRQTLSLQEAMTDVSPKISTAPRPATADIHRLEKLVAVKVDLERRIEADADMLAEITGAINSLPDPIHSTVLANRYIAGMGWMEIAGELNYSKRQILRLHRDALSVIENTSLGGTK